MNGATLKLARANRHIRDLENICEAFIAENPHRFVCEEDPKSGMAHIRVIVDRQLPMEVSTIIGDVLHNLRSSLDHLAAMAIRHNGNSPTSYTQFPVCGTPSDLNGIIPQKLLGASDIFIRFIREVKPYRDGGDGVVFFLSRLDNMDKHDTLVPSISAHRIHDVKCVATSPNGARLLMNIGTIEARGGNFNFAAMPSGATMELNPEAYASFHILFHNTGIVDDLPVIDTLKRYYDRCREIITNARF